MCSDMCETMYFQLHFIHSSFVSEAAVVIIDYTKFTYFFLFALAKA